MSRKGENIYKRKDGRWEGRYIKEYSEVGKAKYGYLYARSYSEIKSKLYQAVTKSNRVTKTVSRRFVVSEIGEKWLELVRVRCRPSTYTKYRNIFENHIKHPLGRYPIAQVGSDAIQSFVASLLVNGKKGQESLSRKTAQDICSVLKQIFLYAEENYDCPILLSPKLLRIKQERKEIKTMTLTEVETLCAYLIKTQDPCKVGVLLSVYTGLRIGELCALQWQDISFTEGTVHINKTVQRIQTWGGGNRKTELVISAPKSKNSNRYIPISETLLGILSPWKTEDDCFILSGSKKILEPRLLQIRFSAFLQESGLPKTNFHTLRHTFATRCVEIGIDPKTLSEILGHASVNITLGRYVHSSIDLKKEAINRLSFKWYSPSESPSIKNKN